jgi:hypothetical protein
VALLAASLVACGGGGGSSGDPIVVNRPPTISGTPATTATVGQPYLFQPVASDPDGQPLQFSITNKPVWGAFDVATGRLSGTPPTGSASTYAGIVIAVSDGQLSASLPAFSIVVSAPQVNRAELQWTPPTQNEDGTPLTNLAGYVVRYGQSPSNLTTTLDLPDPTATGVVIESLGPGTWYFSVAAYSSTFMESAQTDPVSKTIN